MARKANVRQEARLRRIEEGVAAIKQEQKAVIELLGDLKKKQRAEKIGRTRKKC